MAEKINWQETDTKFLEALLLATGGEGGALLQEVLLMADAVDGTVFTLKEVKQSLEELLAVPFVSINKNKLALTIGFLQQYETITLQQRETGSHNLLLELLQKQTITEAGMEEAKAILKKYKLKNYYQQYQEQFGG